MINQEISKKIVKEGVVLHNKMEKTAVVTVAETYAHPIYKKTVNRSKKYLVHDEFEKTRPGDIVQIEQSRPFSKRKHWIVKKIIGKKAS
jgi:small subunit ribosomal protein S17